jgi:hypothetical protein
MIYDRGYRWWKVVAPDGTRSVRYATWKQLMRVDDDVLKCVCFVGYRGRDKNGLEKPVVKGTGFFVFLTDRYYTIVTAMHVIAAVRDEAPDQKVAVWVNYPEGNYRQEYPIESWLGHPSGDISIDVAVLCEPIDPGPLDHLAFTREGFATEALLQDPIDRVGVGDDLYFPGLFAPHWGRDRNLPIVRQGTIAAMPIEKVRSRIGGQDVLIDAYLAEVRSVGGLSGSPVFIHFGMWRVVPGTPEDAPIPPMRSDALLGIIHGHYDLPKILANSTEHEMINMGICMVVPIKYVVETLDQPRMQKKRDELNAHRESDDGVPVADAVPENSEPTAFTKGDFGEALRRSTRIIMPDESVPEG